MNRKNPDDQYIDKKRMVTRAELDELTRRKNQAPGQYLKYEPKGRLNTTVKATERARLQGQITRGERKLASASHKLDNDYAWSSLPGRSRADWMKVADEREARNTPKYHKSKDTSAERTKSKAGEFSDDVMAAVERREARAQHHNQNRSRGNSPTRS